MSKFKFLETSTFWIKKGMKFMASNWIYKFRANKIEELFPTGNEETKTKIPRARSGHRIVTDNGNVYSFGGYNPHFDQSIDEGDPLNWVWFQNCPLFRELWKFNLATRTWEKLKTQGHMPSELASHSVILLGKTLVVFGGTGVPFGASSSNKLHTCGLKSLEWMEVPTKGDVPREQYGQAVTVHGDYLYAIGGTTGFEYSIDVHRLNLHTNEWEELLATGKPEERYRHEVIIYEGKIYVFGGGTALDSFGFKHVPAFDLETRTWENLKTKPDMALKVYPKERRCHGCVKYKSDVYICGGHNGSTIFPDIWKLNLKTMQWKKLKEKLRRPVYFHSTTLSDSGQLFIFGGVTSIQDNKRSNRMFSMWLDVPPLREMCWNSIVHYMPKMKHQSREKLLDAGVPADLLNRVDFADGSEQEDHAEEQIDPAMP